MRNGFKIVDIDTHVNPSYETLVKYLDPGGRSRVDELQPFAHERLSGRDGHERPDRRSLSLRPLSRRGA